MRETTFTELRNQAKTFFDAVEEGVPVRGTIPAWKKPPAVQLSLGSLRLSDEILADRNGQGKPQ